MEFTQDDRGVSEVIGAILVFGLLIALMAVLQMQAVPAANEEVEFNHNQKVQSDLVGFQEAASRVASQGSPESSKIQMGTTYPSRMLFFSPNNPSGTLRTVETSNAAIRNVSATDSTIQKYIDGEINGLQTKRLEYKPNYNEYQSSPTTVLEYGTLYSDFDDRQLVENPGSIVDGNSISLTFFEGDLSRTTGSTMAIEARPTSAPSRTVNVEPTESNMTIELATRLSEEKWENILSDEPNVKGVRHDGDVVKIDLDGSQTYSIQMAKVGVGNNIESPSPEYLVPTGGLGPSTVGIQSNTLPFELRDRYNNPVNGEKVNISVSQGQFDNNTQSTTATTNNQGRPNVRYSASQSGIVTVNVSFAGDPTNPSYSFEPDTAPADLQFRMVVDPSQDSQDPTIENSTSAQRTDYTVCGGQSSVIGQLSCTLGASTLEYAQITVDYSLVDDGPGGLDSMKVKVTDDNGDVLMTDVLGVSGSSSSGTYRSPQVFLGEGSPSDVTLTVTDKAGNTDTRTISVN